MAEEVPRTLKNEAFKQLSSYLENRDPVEQNKRGKDSFLKPPDSSLWICKNPACRATQSTGPRFCKRNPTWKVGVRALQVQLDGCFSCASCGKVSSIIGCWKKQLKIAMDTNRALVYKHGFRSLAALQELRNASELVMFSRDSTGREAITS